MRGLWVINKAPEKPSVSTGREFRHQFLFLSSLIGKELDFAKIDGSVKTVPKAHTNKLIQHPTPDIVVLPTRNPTVTISDVSIQIFESMDIIKNCIFIYPSVNSNSVNAESVLTPCSRCTTLQLYLQAIGMCFPPRSTLASQRLQI